MSKYIDLTGERFGKLTVIEKMGLDDKGRRLWLCKCDCGNTKLVDTTSLKQGWTKSCGCLRSLHPVSNSYQKHGMTNTKEYGEWRHMKDRCCNPNSPVYSRYGGRGIRICDRWSDFNNFYSDISTLPNFGVPGYSLDRIDNDGDYTPDNVRWATQQEQTNNRNSNVVVSYNGETRTLAEWSRELGINYRTLLGRFRRGWSVERAFMKKKQTIARENSNYYYERKK